MSNLVKSIMRNKKLADMISIKKPDTFISSTIPAIDILFSGRIMNSGIKRGAISEIAADSTMGKSIIGLHFLAEAFRTGMDCFVIDTERAFDYKIANALGINMDDVGIFDTQIISDLKEIFTNIAKDVEKKDRENVFVLLDSWGDLVSTQVMAKAEEGSSTVDMGSTSKFKNELANIMHACGFTVLVINHTYASLQMYGDPKNIPGGSKLYFNSDAIVLVNSAAKVKDDETKTVLGKICNAVIKKGREAVENSKVKYRIMVDRGVDRWFGLLDDLVESGVVNKDKPGSYYRVDIDLDKTTGEITKTFKEEETYSEEFVKPLLTNTKFSDFIKCKYNYHNDVDALARDVVKAEPTVEDENIASEAEKAERAARKARREAKKQDTSTPEPIEVEKEISAN